MLKNKSLADFNCVSDQQLFTELTPEEAAAIEGGYYLYLKTLECFEEPYGSDSYKVVVEVDGSNVHSFKGDMDPGEVWHINRGEYYQNYLTVSIWEEDPLLKDDFIGSMTIKRPAGSGFVEYRGSGYHFGLTYRSF